MGFAMPFQAPADEALEVHLYCSEDRGQTWRLYERQKPPATAAGAKPAGGQFQFRASRDGEYWFASRTVDPRRRYDPPKNMLPEMRVLIDTLEPKIDLVAEIGPSGEVKAAWKLFDENLRSQSLKLEFQTDPHGQWQPVAIDRARLNDQLAHIAGDVAWWPKDSSAEIAVRAEVRDAAGNVAVVNKRLALPAQARAGNTAPEKRIASVPPAAERLPPTDASANAAGKPATPVSGPTGLPGNPPADPFSQRRRELEQSPPAGRSDLDNTRSIPWPADPAPGGASSETDFQQRAKRATLPTDFPTKDEAPSAQVQAPAEADSLPGGERPRMTTSRRFRLDYDIEAVGPSGLGKVELWYTRDRGRSWHSKGYDADKQSPFDVEVESEGMYGFRILIENGDGLASRMPQPGDPADLWVTVDWSVPVARLTSAIYGVGVKAGQLEIGWKAEDANLTDRPITLSFSEQATGPWSTIAAGLENTGSYSWKVDPRIPERIFLRLEVRDEAGNVQVDQLREPISIEGLAPKGRIRGFKLEDDAPAAGKEAARPARPRRPAGR
jgi:hypothetical protein